MGMRDRYDGIGEQVLLRVQFTSKKDGLRRLLALLPFRCMTLAAEVFPFGFGRDQRKRQVIVAAFRAKGKLFDVFQNFLFVG
jgi:hypothetical protein